MKYSPLDVGHINKPSGKENIFTQVMWTNKGGYNAITDIENRKQAESIMLFGQTYFPEHFPSKHPRVHTDILALMVSDDKFKALALPRGHSKSTIVSFLLPLYRLCMQERKFIAIVSESEDKAKDFLIRIRDELENNKELIKDFSMGGFKTTDWSKTDLTTSTDVRIVAKGTGQSLRGSIHRDTRFDMVILDDIETDENAGDVGVLRFLLTNVFKSVNKRGVYDICYIGTIICDMAVLHQMLISDEFSSAKYEALDENDDMIAPMLLPREEYEREKRLSYGLGKMSLFYAEYHNNPLIGDEDTTFNQDYFQYFKEEELDSENMNFYIAYDPAMPDRAGKKGKADRSAIIVLATDNKENWYVVRVYANRDTPSKNRKLLFNLASKYKVNKVWMETIAAQRAMYMEIKKEMKEKNIKFPFEEIPSQSGSKEARIEQLQPLYESGRIYHNKNDKEIIELERELMLFGRTPHDDRSDTLSFFLNRVKYPRRKAQMNQRKINDFFDKFYGEQSSQGWKIV
jgi:predicted phage terminase large subunit-like protein